MPNNSDVYGNHLVGGSYRNDLNEYTKLVNNTRSSDKKLNKNYLDELNKEGYRLIKWSNELASLNKNNNGSSQQQPSNVPSFDQRNNLNNLQQHQNYAAPGSNFDNFNYYGKENAEKEELLAVIRVLYNNYNNLLKKYYELSEQNNSYLEGIREYQHKLDNSNYVIQLLNSSHSNYNKLNSQQLLQEKEENDLSNNFNQVANKTQELQQQQYLEQQNKQNKEKEEELNRKLDEVKEKLKSVEEKEQQLNEKLNELDVLMLEENNRLEELKKKELQVLLRQKSLSLERESTVRSHYEQQEEEDSENQEQKLQQLFEQQGTFSLEKKVNTEETHAAEVNNNNDGEGEANKKEEDENLLLLNNINTDIINSIYIKNLNDNNGGMYVIKKGFFNSLKSRNCKLVVKDMVLCLFVRRKLANQFRVQDLSKLEYGPSSISYKLYYKNLSYNWPDPNCYFTIYSSDKRCLNIISDSKDNVSVWFNSLNSLLYILNGPFNNDLNDKLFSTLAKQNANQTASSSVMESRNSLTNYKSSDGRDLEDEEENNDNNKPSQQNTGGKNLDVMKEYLNEFNKVSVFRYYTDSMYNNVFNVLS